MIFVTIGSHEPFDRLIRAVDDVAGTMDNMRFFGQITSKGTHTPVNFDAVDGLGPDEYAKTCEAADVIVSHAGMGTIITALQLGKPLVIMPRRAHLQETRNDHQYATAGKFAAKPGIFYAEDETELEAALTAAINSLDTDRQVISDVAEERLVAFLRAAIA